MITANSDEPSAISAVRPRVLLAALLWRANQPVPVDELAELVWDGAPPSRVPEATRALIVRLRRELSEPAANRIVTSAAGYAIEVSRDELDASRFAALTQQADDAIGASQWARAALCASQALGLWRGTPLADIPSQLLRDQWVPHLEQLHLQALAAYQRARDALAPENAEPASLAVSEPARGVPRELPSALAGFTGRSVQLRALTGLLDEAPKTVVISAIGGTAGVGKTTLAVHWAHQVASSFPDGQLYVNLRGYDPGQPMPAADALGGFLRSLGVPGRDIPPEADRRAARYRSLIADKKMLIVLDNARDEQQIRPLLPDTAAGLVIVTSRSQLSGLAAADGARLLSLDVLPHDEAVRLLTARIGQDRIAAEPGAADEIAALCARLPLALAVAAARAAARPRFPLTALAAELRDSAERLDLLDAGEEAVSVRAVFSWSYQQLSLQAARMFRLLGLHPGPDISARAAASLAAADEDETNRLLRELARDCLITEHAPGRYTFHDLLRAYAAETARDSQGERDAALSRILDHYLHTARNGRKLLRRPEQEALTLAPPSPGTSPEQPADYRQAMAWFTAEHHVLLATSIWAAETGTDRRAWQLPCAMADYFRRRGYPQEQVTVMTSALAAATRLGDELGQAMSLRRLGYAWHCTGDYQQAHALLEQCIPLYQRLGDRLGEALTQQNLAFVAESQGRYADGLGHSEKARGLMHDIGDEFSAAEAQGNSGWYHALLGDYEQARTFCAQSLAVIARHGGSTSEHAIQGTLGYLEHHLGNFAQAAAHHEAALALSREISDAPLEGAVLHQIGDTRHAAGQLEQARHAWEQALAIYECIHHRDTGKVRAKLASAEPSEAARTSRFD